MLGWYSTPGPNVKPGIVVLLDEPPPPTDVLVLVEPAQARDTIDTDARQHYAAHLQTPGGAPMRRGADEASAGEGVIDGLVQIIELGEWT